MVEEKKKLSERTKKFFKSIPGKFKIFLKNIYDKDTKKVLNRTWADLGKVAVFYILFYVVCGFIFWAHYATFVELLNSSGNPDGPSSSELLRNFITFKSSTGVLELRRTFDNAYIGKSIQDIESLLEKYDNPSGSLCDINSLPGSSCRFDRNDLGQCNLSPFGFDTNVRCFYLELNKVTQFAPIAGQNENRRFIRVECEGDLIEDMGVSGKENLTITPPGILRAGLPYLPNRNIPSPLISFTIDVTRFNSVTCRLIDRNIIVQELEDNSRARGSIFIRIID